MECPCVRDWKCGVMGARASKEEDKEEEKEEEKEGRGRTMLRMTGHVREVPVLQAEKEKEKTTKNNLVWDFKVCRR